MLAIVVQNVCCCSVVGYNACRILFVAHFFKGGAKGKFFTTVDEATSNFGFGGGCHDVFENGGDGE